MSLKTWLKPLSAVLSLVYFLANCVFPHTAEANLAAARRRTILPETRVAQSFPSGSTEILHNLRVTQVAPLSSSLSNALHETLPRGFDQTHASLLTSLPYSYGQIKKIIVGGGPLTVVHIQDVHMNTEAQENIARTVQSLVGGHQASLVALEGASGPLLLRRFRNFPDHASVRDAADYLLAKNEISGPIHAAITAPQEIPPIVGIDDPDHYQANVEAYRRSAVRQTKYREKIRLLRAALDARKTAVFNRELLNFDRTVEANRARQIPLGRYVKTILQEAVGGSTVSALLQALRMEESTDFKQVEKERDEVITRLARKISAEDLSSLMGRSLAYRLGGIRYADFYRYIQSLSARNGVDLKSYPAMAAYIEYVLLSDGIDAQKLSTEIARAEKDAYTRLAHSDEERRLVAESKQLYLTARLVDFALTSEEWHEYRTFAGEKAYSGLDLSSFEDFYREADIRSESIVENLFRESEKLKRTAATERGDVAVLVTGGFHSEQIEERLTQRGATVITFAPKITRADSENGSTYLSVFTREKTPIEKLFEGEKLFLANAPFSSAASERLALLAASGAPDAKDAVLRLSEHPRGIKSVSAGSVNGRTAIIITYITGTILRLKAWREAGKLKRDEETVRQSIVLTAALGAAFSVVLLVVGSMHAGSISAFLVSTTSLFLVGLAWAAAIFVGGAFFLLRRAVTPSVNDYRVEKLELHEGDPAQGHEIYRLTDAAANSSLEVDLTTGFNVTTYKSRGRDIFYSRGNPVMAPWMGRIAEGKFTDGEGVAHDLTNLPPGLTKILSPEEGGHAMHGVVRNQAWTFVGRGADAAGAWITAEYTLADPTLVAAFGPLTYRLTYRLSGGQLSIETKILNNDSERPHWAGIGFHPWFRIPEDPAQRARVRLTVPARAAWPVDPTKVPYGNSPLPVDGRLDLRSGPALADETYDDPLTDLNRDPDGWSTSLIDIPDWNLRVRIRASDAEIVDRAGGRSKGRGFTDMVVNAELPAEKKPFLNVEPQTAPPNFPNLPSQFHPDQIPAGGTYSVQVVISPMEMVPSSPSNASDLGLVLVLGSIAVFATTFSAWQSAGILNGLLAFFVMAAAVLLAVGINEIGHMLEVAIRHQQRPRFETSGRTGILKYIVPGVFGPRISVYGAHGWSGLVANVAAALLALSGLLLTNAGPPGHMVLTALIFANIIILFASWSDWISPIESARLAQLRKWLQEMDGSEAWDTDSSREVLQRVWDDRFRMEDEEKIRDATDSRRSPFAMQGYKTIARMFPQGTKRILEAGSGSGKNVIAWAAEHPKGTGVGVDLSLEALRTARVGAELRGVDNTRFVAGDITDLPFADNSFDAVFNEGVLEHFHPTEFTRMVREMVRVTRSGGSVVVAVPNYNSFSIAFAMWWNGIDWRDVRKNDAYKLWRYGFEQPQKPGEWKKLFESMGLTDIEVDGFDPLYGFGVYRWDPVKNRRVYPWYAFALRSMVRVVRPLIALVDYLTGRSFSRRFGYEFVIKGVKRQPGSPPEPSVATTPLIGGFLQSHYRDGGPVKRWFVKYPFALLSENGRVFGAALLTFFALLPLVPVGVAAIAAIAAAALLSLQIGFIGHRRVLVDVSGYVFTLEMNARQRFLISSAFFFMATTSFSAILALMALGLPALVAVPLGFLIGSSPHIFQNRFGKFLLLAGRYNDPNEWYTEDTQVSEDPENGQNVLRYSQEQLMVRWAVLYSCSAIVGFRPNAEDPDGPGELFFAHLPPRDPKDEFFDREHLSTFITGSIARRIPREDMPNWWFAVVSATDETAVLSQTHSSRLMEHFAGTEVRASVVKESLRRLGADMGKVSVEIAGFSSARNSRGDANIVVRLNPDATVSFIAMRDLLRGPLSLDLRKIATDPAERARIGWPRQVGRTVDELISDVRGQVFEGGDSVKGLRGVKLADRVMDAAAEFQKALASPDSRDAAGLIIRQILGHVESLGVGSTADPNGWLGEVQSLGPVERTAFYDLLRTRLISLYGRDLTEAEILKLFGNLAIETAPARDSLENVLSSHAPLSASDSARPLVRYVTVPSTWLDRNDMEGGQRRIREEIEAAARVPLSGTNAGPAEVIVLVEEGQLNGPTGNAVRQVLSSLEIPANVSVRLETSPAFYNVGVPTLDLSVLRQELARAYRHNPSTIQFVLASGVRLDRSGLNDAELDSFLREIALMALNELMHAVPLTPENVGEWIRGIEQVLQSA